MIDRELARQLKEAGLEWLPTKRDNFMIPDGELANEVFTLNDQTIVVQPVKGQFMILFHGSAEWALDHVMLSDVIWLPSETQLREAIQLRLRGEAAMIALQWTPVGYRCTVSHVGQDYSFEGVDAEQVYAHALLFLLRREQLVKGRWVQSA